MLPKACDERRNLSTNVQSEAVSIVKEVENTSWGVSSIRSYRKFSADKAEIQRRKDELIGKTEKIWKIGIVEENENNQAT